MLPTIPSVMTDSEKLNEMEVEEDSSTVVVSHFQEETLSGDCGKSVSVERHPEWVNNLLEYFTFCEKHQRIVKEKDKDRKRDYYTLKCLLCSKKQESTTDSVKDSSGWNKKKKVGKGCGKIMADVQLVGCNASSFARHLQVKILLYRIICNVFQPVND